MNKFYESETVKVINCNRLCIGKITRTPIKKSDFYVVQLTHHRDGKPFGNKRTLFLTESDIFKTDFKDETSTR